MVIFKKLFNYIRNRLRWLNYFYKDKTRNKNFIELNADGKECIALIPHADDELIGMGTLLSKARNIRLVYFEYLGSNYNEDNRKIREEEFQLYCSKLNVKYSHYDKEAEKKILSADIVFLPSLVDWHSEHRRLNYILKDLLNNSGKKPQVVWYNISVYGDISEHACFITETKADIRKKYNDLSTIYISQKNLPVSRFKIKERLYGKHIGKYAAEKYIWLEYEYWSEIVDIFKLKYENDELITLKQKLNDFDSINRISDTIYKDIMR